MRYVTKWHLWNDTVVVDCCFANSSCWFDILLIFSELSRLLILSSLICSSNHRSRLLNWTVSRVFYLWAWDRWNYEFSPSDDKTRLKLRQTTAQREFWLCHLFHKSSTIQIMPINCPSIEWSRNLTFHVGQFFGSILFAVFKLCCCRNGMRWFISRRVNGPLPILHLFRFRSKIINDYIDRFWFVVLFNSNVSTTISIHSSSDTSSPFLYRSILSN
jgi:hypothetical protein